MAPWPQAGVAQGAGGPTSSLRHVAGAGTAALAAATAALVAGPDGLRDELASLARMTSIAALTAAAAMLLATARLDRSRPAAGVAAWLGAGLLLITGAGGLLGQLWLLAGGRPGGWLVAVPVGALLVHTGLDRSQRQTPRAAAAALLPLTLVAGLGQLLPWPQGWLVTVVACAAALATLPWRLARHPGVPAVHRSSLAVGVGLLALTALLLILPPVAGLTAVLLGVLVAASVTLLGTAWRWTCDTGDEATRRLDELAVDLAVQERQAVSVRERLHDARSTLAGIRAARSALADGGVTTLERSGLEQALESEIDRLVRLLSGRSASGPTRLDDLLPPLALTWRRRGVDLRYRPVPAEVTADPDTVAEIVGNLVDNAIEHAPGATVRLVTDQVGAHVLLSVVDDGPGVPAELRSTVMTAGIRRAGSRGEGLGLAAAARLATDAGGELRLLDVERGAWFLLRLPATDRPCEEI